MSESANLNATALLRVLLETQPNVITPCEPNKESGEKVAEFMAAFVLRYAALLDDVKPTGPWDMKSERRKKPR